MKHLFYVEKLKFADLLYVAEDCRTDRKYLAVLKKLRQQSCQQHGCCWIDNINFVDEKSIVSLSLDKVKLILHEQDDYRT